MGPAGAGRQDVAGRSRTGRGIQARRLSEDRGPPRRQRQAAHISGGHAYRRDRRRHRPAGGEGAGGRHQRQRRHRRHRAGQGRAARQGERAAELLMAQLTDDCFAFSGPLLRLDDMERLIGERIAPVTEVERVPLRDARGRVLSADVVAPVDLPPFDNSAVDGYAVRHADLKADADTRLTISGRLMAGADEALSLGPGQAIRIFTGAAMPANADTVFMQEDVTRDGDAVVVPKGLKRGANRRLAGEDVAKGAVALAAGTVLEPQHIALAAALGVTSLEVRRRLNVAIFSTGDEVVEPGGVLPRAAVYDANRYLLRELIERLGANVTDLGILADDPEPLARALRAAASAHDLIVTSGGV